MCSSRQLAATTPSIIAPIFWKELVEHASNGRLLSIDRVKNELVKGKDELEEWARSEFHKYFVSTADSGVIEAYREIINWAMDQKQFTNDAKYNFAKEGNADAWLVAYAKAKGGVVVTHEKYDPKIKRKIKIPNVCRAFGITYIDTFDMLRQLGVVFQ
jgi:hypothetical protein